MDLSAYCHYVKDQKLIGRLAMLEAAWKISYPDVDLHNQASWAHAWLVSNGKKYTDMRRFLNHWFQTCQKTADEKHEIERRQGERRATPKTIRAVREEDTWKPDMTDDEMREIRKRNLG